MKRKTTKPKAKKVYTHAEACRHAAARLRDIFKGLPHRTLKQAADAFDDEALFHEQISRVPPAKIPAWREARRIKRLREGSWSFKR